MSPRLYCLGDFRPGEIDLDYIVVVTENLSDAEVADVMKLHDLYRSEQDSMVRWLEGTIGPAHVMANQKESFVGCYIGTRRSGWRKVGFRPRSQSIVRVTGSNSDTVKRNTESWPPAFATRGIRTHEGR